MSISPPISAANAHRREAAPEHTSDPQSPSRSHSPAPASVEATPAKQVNAEVKPTTEDAEASKTQDPKQDKEARKNANKRTRIDERPQT